MRTFLGMVNQLIKFSEHLVYKKKRASETFCTKETSGHGEVSNRKNFSNSNLTSHKCWYPQNKNGLALPWTCGRSWEYHVGKSVTKETDQKPLKLFLSAHTFDQLPQRIQRFRMQLISFHFRNCACPWREDVRCLKPSSPAYHWWWQN